MLVFFVITLTLGGRLYWYEHCIMNKWYSNEDYKGLVRLCVLTIMQDTDYYLL